MSRVPPIATRARCGFGRAVSLPATSLATLFVLLGAALHPPQEQPAPSGGPVSAVRVTVETIAVDRRGTWSVGTDIADIFSGSTGVLKKSATLISRDGAGTREMVDLTARITPTLAPAGGCSLRLETEARTVVAGAKTGSRPRRPDITRAAINLKPDEERLVEAFASSATQGRLALKVKCGSPASPSESDVRFVDFVLSVARGEGDKEPQPMKSNQLRASFGREASNLFSFNVTLDPDATGDKRYRREELELTLTPALKSGGRLQVDFAVRGELATVSAGAPPITHPFDHQDTLILAPGETRSLDIDVHSSGADEGWTRVRYRLGVTGAF